MKTIASFLSMSVLLITWAATDSLAQVTTPRTASPAASLSQTIGISTVTVNYSRPSVRGREVWGALVPYGWNAQGFGNGNSAPWRAGANENTTITLSHEAKIEGTTVPAGTYGLFYVINADNSGEVILSKDYRSWGSFFYEPKQDQLRAKITIRDHPHTEMLTYDFINVGKNSAELVLNWEKKQFPVKIEFAVDEIVMANAVEELKGPVGFTPQGFISAANYALQNDINHDLALQWIDQALVNDNSFAAKRIKAGLLEKAGRTEESRKIMEDAIATATEGELNTYGYQLLNQSKHDEAIRMFLMNTERHPKSANAWDSLGEGYAIKGDRNNAVKCFKKCLSLNPPANVRANSEKYLKRFDAL